MPARIRRARAQDAAALSALEAHFPGDRMSPRAIRRLLRSPSAQVWVATDHAAVLGALMLLTRSNSGVARIYSLVIDPRARGQGLGRRLVQTAERAARRERKAMVRLEVRVDNRAAQALYARLGFAEEQRLPAYYEDGGDALRLRKSLSPKAYSPRSVIS